MYWCFFRGRYSPLDEATCSLKDMGLLRGYGIFETMLCIEQKPLFLSHHLERLSLGAQTLNLPFEKELIVEVIHSLLKKTKQSVCGIKCILTGGESPGLYPSRDPSLFLFSFAPTFPTKKEYKEGISAISTPKKGEGYPFKTLNYLEGSLALQKAARVGAKEAIYVQEGKLLEATTANLFVYKNGLWRTPKEGIIEGVTRSCLLKTGKISLHPILYKELDATCSACITSSLKGVLPLSKIDSIPLHVGEEVKEFLSLYEKKKGEEVYATS